MRLAGGRWDSAMTQLEQVQDDVAFREGVFIRALGRPLSKNPYPKRSAEGARWEAGWRLIDKRETAPAPPSDAPIAPSADPRPPGEMILFFVIYVVSLAVLGGLLLWCLLMTVK
jgi:hypothetical protein